MQVRGSAMGDMRGINKYWIQLSDSEIQNGVYRQRVGGYWEQLGKLQYDFVRNQGLLPSHRLLDIGCGALRGGIHFIGYLESSHYYGFDINESLLKAARHELTVSGLSTKNPILILDSNFNYQDIDQPIDIAIAISLFTHLHINLILRCLRSLREVMSPTGVLYATFFETKDQMNLADVQQGGGIVTHFDSDPFHYTQATMRWMAEQCDYAFEYLGEWGHPRNQKMMALRIR
jgi:cyclopropane fatty-acyl-phospholipid synthase-like methyltransferase